MSYDYVEACGSDMGLEEEGRDLRGGESLRCQSLKNNGVESEARGVERVVVLLYEKLTHWGISNVE